LTPSSAESTPRKLKLVKVEDITPTGLKPSSNGYLTEVTAVLTAIAMLLAARFQLLLASIGGFVLALLALPSPDAGKIAILVIWCVGVILPIAYLYLRNGHGEAQEGSGS